jgi:hypothetical protein
MEALHARGILFTMLVGSVDERVARGEDVLAQLELHDRRSGGDRRK